MNPWGPIVLLLVVAILAAVLVPLAVRRHSGGTEAPDAAAAPGAGSDGSPDAGPGRPIVLPPEVEEQVLALVAARRKVQAMKIVRHHSSAPVAEVQAYVEQMER